MEIRYFHLRSIVFIGLRPIDITCFKLPMKKKISELEKSLLRQRKKPSAKEVFHPLSYFKKERKQKKTKTKKKKHCYTLLFNRMKISIITALPRCYPSPFNLYNWYSSFLFAHKGFKLCSGFEFHKKSRFKTEMLLFHNRSQNLSRNTGGPSSSCEMILLRNKSRGEIKIVSMGLFTTAPRNKKNTVKFSIFPYKLS